MNHEVPINIGGSALVNDEFLNCLIVEIHADDVKDYAPSTLTEFILNNGAPGTKFIPTVYFQWYLTLFQVSLSSSDFLNPSLSIFLN